MPPIHASQPSLSRTSPSGKYTPPAAPEPLSPASSLAAAMQAYHAYLGAGYSAHTLKVFVHDIALLAGSLGIGRPTAEVADRCPLPAQALRPNPTPWAL